MFVSKPTSREGILIFGDGDEAAFITCGHSTYEGYLYFKYRPTPQMKWRKQIQPDQFHPDDHTINKIYKKELCVQLSFDPDFPMWLILCDCHGNEETPFIDNFIKCIHFIKRNRDIEQENKMLWATVNRIRKQSRRKAEHPTEDEHEKLNFLKYVHDQTKPSYPQQQPDMMMEEQQ